MHYTKLLLRTQFCLKVPDKPHINNSFWIASTTQSFVRIPDSLAILTARICAHWFILKVDIGVILDRTIYILDCLTTEWFLFLQRCSLSYQ